MLPDRVSVLTLNLWKDNRWADRAPSVRAFLDHADPDIAAFQELRPQTRDHLDEVLGGHARVTGELPGWSTEGNVYWRESSFRALDHGAIEVGILEEDRRLFWVRLVPRDDNRSADRSVLVCTAHFTYAGNDREVETGQSPRVDQARQTVDALAALGNPGEPVLFMGDLNDAVHPTRILAAAGYTDCFSELGVPVRPTFPAWPTKDDADAVVEMPLDWLVANEHATSRAAMVPEFFHDGVAPSDHWPVLAMYELWT